MYNWSVDTKELKKNKERYAVWKIEQLLNYGLRGRKIEEKLVRKYWEKLMLDPPTRKYLEFILWPPRRRS